MQKCKYCGCTEDNACRYEFDGETVSCFWFRRDVCSNPVCVARDAAEQKKYKPELREWLRRRPVPKRRAGGR
jgi:hypothetical protein